MSVNANGRRHDGAARSCWLKLVGQERSVTRLQRRELLQP